MDIQRPGDMYDCFSRYQRQMQRLFRAMQTTYGFAIIDANQPPQVIAQELSAHIAQLLGLQPSEFELK